MISPYMFTTLRKLWWLAALLFYHTAGAHQADSLCSNKHCGCTAAAIPTGIMFSHVHQKNEWMFSYRYMYMDMHGMLNGTSTIDNNTVFKTYLMAPERMQMNMHMLMAMYGINNRLTVMAMLHYNTTSMSMSMFATSSHHHGGGSNSSTHTMSSTGLGDTRLHLLYAPVNNAHHSLVTSMGIGIPTGSVEVKGPGNDMMYANQHLPYAMQPGSGSVDLLPGLAYHYTGKKLGTGIQVTSIIRTNLNQLGYKHGNEYTLNTWVSYQWWRFLSTSLRAEAVGWGSIKGYDPSLYRYNEPAAHPYNYGGQKLNGFAGIRLQPTKGRLSSHSIGAEYGLPFYQNLNGIQMPVKHMLFLSWSLTL